MKLVQTDVSQSLPFMIRVKVSYLESDTHKVMTALILVFVWVGQHVYDSYLESIFCDVFPTILINMRKSGFGLSYTTHNG
jgi:hypothetical protein